MNKNNPTLKRVFTVAILAASLIGCAGTGMKSSGGLDVLSNDRIFMQIAPFDSTVQLELKRTGLDPEKIHEAIVSELHYQLYLKHWEESPDSAGSTVQITVVIAHLQPGTGNSGDFVSGTVSASRKTVQKVDWELRQSSRDNVPVEFLPPHLSRQLADEIIAHMKNKPKSDPNDLGYPPPLILLH